MNEDNMNEDKACFNLVDENDKNNEKKMDEKTVYNYRAELFSHCTKFT